MTATPNGPTTRSWIDPAVRQDDLADGGVVVAELLRRGAQEPAAGAGRSGRGRPGSAARRRRTRRPAAQRGRRPRRARRSPSGRASGGGSAGARRRDHRRGECQPGEEQAAREQGHARRARRRRPPRSAAGGTGTRRRAARARSSRARPGKEMTTSGQDPTPSGPSSRTPPEHPIATGAIGQRPCADPPGRRSEGGTPVPLRPLRSARQGRLSTGALPGAEAIIRVLIVRRTRNRRPAAAPLGRGVGGDPARARDGRPGARDGGPDPARARRRLAAHRDAVDDDHLRGPVPQPRGLRRPTM